MQGIRNKRVVGVIVLVIVSCIGIGVGLTAYFLGKGPTTKDLIDDANNLSICDDCKFSEMTPSERRRFESKEQLVDTTHDVARCIGNECCVIRKNDFVYGCPKRCFKDGSTPKCDFTS